jgi:hypothetical protein
MLNVYIRLLAMQHIRFRIYKAKEKKIKLWSLHLSCHEENKSGQNASDVVGFFVRKDTVTTSRQLHRMYNIKIQLSMTEIYIGINTINTTRPVAVKA